jgi:DNA gyrase subunit A
MGRTAAGVGAVHLVGDDTVAGFDIVEPGGELLALTEQGWGKRTPLSEFRTASRNTQGVWALAHDWMDMTGRVAAARVVQPQDQVTIITAGGVALRTPIATISRMGRAARGVRIVNLENGDSVAAMTRLLAQIEQDQRGSGAVTAPAEAAETQDLQAASV